MKWYVDQDNTEFCISGLCLFVTRAPDTHGNETPLLNSRSFRLRTPSCSDTRRFFTSTLCTSCTHAPIDFVLVHILVLFLFSRCSTQHSINKTLGVFVPDYHSKFSPADVLESSHVDFWVTNLEVKTCSEVRCAHYTYCS
jgi:hypothetical protein